MTAPWEQSTFQAPFSSTIACIIDEPALPAVEETEPEGTTEGTPEYAPEDAPEDTLEDTPEDALEVILEIDLEINDSPLVVEGTNV